MDSECPSEPKPFTFRLPWTTSAPTCCWHRGRRNAWAIRLRAGTAVRRRSRMYHLILVPLDGSSLAERALSYARSLATVSQAQMVLLRAVEPPSIAESPWQPGLDKEMADAEAYLDGLLPGPNAASSAITSVCIGGAADAIIQESQSRGADLIVMSTHGRSGLARAVYGSVAERVCRDTQVPVLLVTAACQPTWPSDRRKRVLVTLDGSKLAEQALGEGEEIASSLGAEIVLFRAIEPAAQRSFTQ